MTKYHDKLLSFELRTLQRRLGSPKVRQAIEQDASFQTQRLNRRLVAQLEARVEYVLKQVESRHSLLARVKRLFVEEEFDRKVAVLEIETDKMLMKLGIERE